MKHLLFSALRRFGVSAFFVMAALVGLSGEAQALSCPTGKVQQGGLCFKPALPGYSCNGPVCQEDCRSGYSPSLPGFCHYRGSPTYTEKPFGKKHASKPHKCGLFWYANCRAGYRMDLCGTCGYKAAWDTTRAVYTREGTVPPDYTAAFNQVGSKFQATYGSSIGAMQSGYAAAVAQVQQGIDAVTLKLFQQAAKTAMGSGRGAALSEIFKAVKTTVDDPDKLNEMRRILLLVSSKATLTAEDAQEAGQVMLKLGREMGLFCGTQAEVYTSTTGSRLASNMLHSSWGIQTEISGAYIGGVSQSLALVASCDVVDRKLNFAVVSTSGGSLGYEISVGGSVGLLWSPGGLDKQAGPFVGLGGGGKLVAGADGGFSWSIAKGMRGAQNAIPGVSGGAGPGLGGGASLVGGYSHVLQTFSWTFPI
jgi:hypothetical protein